MSVRSLTLLTAFALLAASAHAAEQSTYWYSYESVVTGQKPTQSGYVYGTNHDDQKSLHDSDGNTALSHGHMAYYDGFMTATAHGCAGLPEGSASSGSASGSTETRLSDTLYLRSDTLPYNTPLTVSICYSFAVNLYVNTQGQGVYYGTGGASGGYSFSANGVSGSLYAQGSSSKDGAGNVTRSGTLDAPFPTFTTTLYANNPQSYLYLNARITAGGSSVVQGGQTSQAGTSASMTFGGVVGGDGYLYSGNGDARWSGSCGNASDVLPPNPANPTPEPGSFAALGLGAAGLLRARRRRL